MTLYTATFTLILVMDPLGNIPVFLSILKRFDPKTQSRIIVRETLIAFLVLVGFLFCGQYILQGLQITTPALSIAGAIILFLISIRMIYPHHTLPTREDTTEEPLIVPLAIPLTAGPSALAVLLLFVNRDPGHTLLLLTAVIIACLVFTVIMLSSRWLMKLLGERGLKAVERLMGMLLTTIAVQMFISGLAEYLQHAKALT